MSITNSNKFKSTSINGILSNVDDTVNNITASANIQRDLTIGGDVVLSKSNTYLSGDTNNFTIKNKYPIYTDILSVNSLIIDSNLLFFYTFDENDLQNNYLKNQANNQYDLLIRGGDDLIDGTLNLPSTGSALNGATFNKTFTLNSSGFTIGLWIYLRNPEGAPWIFVSGAPSNGYKNNWIVIRYTDGFSFRLYNGTATT